MNPVMLENDVSTIIPIVAVGGSMFVAVVAIVGGTIRAALAHKHREESRREIAAYVAEGSMSPEDAAKILAAAPAKRRGCC
jgi:hypothetical protein